jgi:putative phosphoribosyl transferase
MQRFRDRRDAGRRLAACLAPLRRADPIVAALPRGGVPVGYEVAHVLDAPLDVVVVRKLGVPTQPELGMGAVGEGGVTVLNDDVVRIAKVTAEQLAAVENRERAEVERRAAVYRRGRAMQPLEDATVVIVDDGIATGGTLRAAVEVVRAHGPSLVVVAAPVAPSEVVDSLRAVADAVFVLATPKPFVAIGPWYEQFAQTSDEEVAELLDAARP